MCLEFFLSKFLQLQASKNKLIHCEEKIAFFFLFFRTELLSPFSPQRMFWQLTPGSVPCGRANSLTSTAKPLPPDFPNIEENQPCHS